MKIFIGKVVFFFFFFFFILFMYFFKFFFFFFQIFVKIKTIRNKDEHVGHIWNVKNTVKFLWIMVVLCKSIWYSILKKKKKEKKRKKKTPVGKKVKLST